MTQSAPPLIVLLYPRTGLDMGPTIAPPHSLLALAAPLLARGFRVRIVDQRADAAWQSHLREAARERPLCFGLSCMTGSPIRFALEIARFVRSIAEAGTPIVWGGPHPSILPEQTLRHELVDMICVGEGEESFTELAEALRDGKTPAGIRGIGWKEAGRVVINEARPLLDVEKLLPIPWEVVNPEDYIHPDMYLKESPRTMDIGQTSRGCPFNCGFCSSASLRQRRWRPMSAEKSLERILGPVRRFNLTGIWIRDDEFYVNAERVRAIGEGIIASGHKFRWYTSGTRVDLFNRASDELLALIKRSGAHTLKFGAESGSDRILELMSKGITHADTRRANRRAREHGLVPAFAFAVGFPGETFAEIDATIDLMHELKRENPGAQLEAVATYCALPGTPLYDLALKSGLKPPERLEDWAGWTSDDYDFAGVRNPWFNRQERIQLGNLTLMSMLATPLSNMADALNLPLKPLSRFLLQRFGDWLKYRLRHKLYRCAPELRFIRFLRRRFLLRNRFVQGILRFLSAAFQNI